MNGSRNGTSPKLGRYEAGAEPIAAPDGARRNGASARASDPVHAWSGSRTQRFLRLLYPGIGLKRWALVGALGVAACSIGVSFLISHLLAVSFPSVLPWYLEGFLLLAFGTGAILLSMYGFYRVLAPLLRSQSIDAVADTVYNRWSRGRGPKVVAIGGGTGLSVLLRGLRTRTDNLTAIITVADDGGSSGILRRELGALPPGDFRNCLVALSEDEPLLADLFQYRFDDGDGLKGHSFGNLFIVAMTDVANSFEEALVESSRILAVRGVVAPSTSADLQLSARFADGEFVRGESSITRRGGSVERLMIEPEDAPAHPLAVRAIEEADLVIIGPGSLYTSILPNILVRGISDALKRTSAPVVYVCNVATQVGETQDYTVRDHVLALQRHTFATIADHVLANSNPIPLGDRFLGEAVIHDGRSVPRANVILADLVDPTHPVRHDANKLASAIMDIQQATGERREATEPVPAE